MARATLFILIDGLGWELIEQSGFLADLAPHRCRLRTVLGDATATVPTILASSAPAQHGHWCRFSYAPDDSPFRRVPLIRHLPGPLARWQAFRGVLARRIARHLGWTGGLELGNIPLRLLHVLDYTAKRDPFEPGGLSPATSAIDRLRQERIGFFLSDPRAADAENLLAAAAALEAGEAPLVLLRLTELGATLQSDGPDSEAARGELAACEAGIRSLYETATRHCDLVRLYVGTDRGVTAVTELVDIRAKVEGTHLELHDEYFALYEPTMARFWFASAAARHRVMDSLDDVVHGRWLGDDQLRIEGLLFDGRRYGEAIFLLDPGLAIAPNYITAEPPAAVGGYHPDHPGSWAAFCSSTPFEIPPRLIGDLGLLLLEGARWAVL